MHLSPKRIVAALFTASALAAILVAPALAGTGNGAPSGAHYNLNIIGVPKGKSASITTGNRIFVSLGSQGNVANTKIWLQQTFDGSFDVIDANGTDGSATFALPAPGTYQIYARYLGKPGGIADMKTCLDVDGDPTTTGDQYCSIGEYVHGVVTTGKGSKQFDNVTHELTTMELNSTVAGLIGCSTSINIFDGCALDYFWNYDNQGLKLMQLRFYSTG